MQGKPSINIFPQPGIYCFGGLKEDGQCTNELKIMLPTRKGYIFSIPKTKGISPMARINHQMIFYEHNRMLVIYGGENNKKIAR